MTKKLLIDIIANDKTKAGLNLVQRRLKSVRQSVFSLKGALVGLGAGAVVKSFVDVGKEVESLQIRFKFLFGTAEEGQIAFENLAKFAGRVPFSLEEISRASGNLAVVADDANDLNRILEITGNVAAVTGLDFETTSSQIQRAFSGGIGAADLFRERGVRALLGFKNGAKVTAEETVKRFEELFAGDGQFANATKDLATTLEGTISMIGDKYFNFQKDVAQGFFDELKKEFGDLNEFLEANEQQIKDIATAIGENFAGAITTTSDLIKSTAPSVKAIADALGTTIEGFKSLPGFVQTSGIIAALLFGKKGAVAFGAVSFLLGQMQEILKEAESVGATGKLNFGDVSDIEELNTQLDGFNRRRKEILEDISKALRGEDTEIPLNTLNTSLVETENNIKNIRDRIRFLETFDKTLELASIQGKEFANALSSIGDSNLDKVFKGIGQDASDYLIRQNSINKAVDAMNKKISALKNFADAYLPIQSVIIASKEQQEELNELVKQGGISAELAGIARQQIEMETYEKIKAIRDQQHQEELARKNEAIQKIEEEGSVLDILIQRYAQLANEFNANQLVADQFMTAVDGLNKALGDAVAQAIVFGKSFEDIFKSAVQNVLSQLISQLVQIGVQMLITKLLGDRLQDAAAKKNEAVMDQIAKNSAEAAALVSLATGGSNAIGAILGIAATYGSTKAIAARQNGGPVFAGQPVMVGETGKEMFVPQQNGQIIPNREIGQGTVINFNITANDTTDFDKLLVKRRGLIVGLINNALNEKGQGALV